jgi:hypothetical protein
MVGSNFSSHNPIPRLTVIYLQQFPIHNPLPHQPTQPKEWDPLLYSTVPQAIPLPSRAPTQVGQEISLLGFQGIINCSEFTSSDLRFFLCWLEVFLFGVFVEVVG